MTTLSHSILIQLFQCLQHVVNFWKLCVITKNLHYIPIYMHDGSKLAENEKSLRFDVLKFCIFSVLFSVRMKKGKQKSLLLDLFQLRWIYLYVCGQIHFLKTWKRYDASPKQAEYSMQFQSKQTIKCNFKASRQSNAISK